LSELKVEIEKLMQERGDLEIGYCKITVAQNVTQLITNPNKISGPLWPGMVVKIKAKGINCECEPPCCERFWVKVTDIHIHEDTIEGIVDNHLVLDVGVKFGDRVKFRKEHIWDIEKISCY
jgi:uncharacterized protein YegJ (DUF2314 family)